MRTWSSDSVFWFRAAPGTNARLGVAALLASVVAGLLGQAGCGRSPNASPPTPQPVLVLPSDEDLRRQLDEVLEATYTRRLSVKEHAAWQILHGVLAYQREFLIDTDNGRVSAIDYLLQGGSMKGWTVEPGERGLRAVVEPGSKIGQGHYDQWLALLAQCGVKPSEQFKVGERTYTMSDIVTQVQWDVPRNVLREYSWTLVGLTSYIPTNSKWQAMDGREWSIERLLEIELEQDITTSACGGTHRLMGLALSLNHHLSQGGKLEGVWKQADERIQEAIETTRRLQNPDGSFSTQFFVRPGSSHDLAQNLAASGHILEFLMLSMTDEQVREPWVTRAVLKVSDILYTTRDLPLECGAVYHAAHGLVLYRERCFGPAATPGSRKPSLNFSSLSSLRSR